MNTNYIVYGWFRKGKYLYIGYTKRGLSYIKHHHTINVLDTVKQGDEIHLFECKNLSHAKELEMEMLIKHKPKFNTHRTGKKSLTSKRIWLNMHLNSNK